MSSCPFVFWAQNESEVFLSVDLKDSTNCTYSIDGNVFDFNGVGIGAQGRRNYAFSLALFGDVELFKASEEGGRRVVYTLKKTPAGWWPTITKEGARISWLRVDFDRFEDPDASENDEDFELINSKGRTEEEEMDELTQRIFKESGIKPRSFSDFRRDLHKCRENCKDVLSLYLVAYNVFLFLAHFYVLTVLLFKIASEGSGYLEMFWEQKSTAIKMATALQLLDVVHSLTGITKTGYQAALMQVLGRLLMIYVVDGDPYLHTALTTYLLIVVWFAIEMFRYPHYALASMKKEIDIVTWLRYTMWIPLYPAGLSLEAATILRAIPYYYYSGAYGISLPNAWNIAFNFGVFLMFVAAAFPFIAFFLVRHMQHQRAKKFAALEKKKVT